MKIAGAALNQTPIDWESNFNTIVLAIEAAKKQGVELLCLPELAITGYGCEDLFFHDWVAETALSYLSKILPHTRGITVNVGLPVKIGKQTYNTVAMLSDTAILGFSAKQNLAIDGIHYENRWFTAWPSGTQSSLVVDGKTYPIGDLVYEVKGKKIAFEICEDAWREHRPAIRYAEQGVDIIMNPSASHFAFGKSELRKQLVIESSRRFNCTYVYANLLGNEAGKIIYDGEIVIAAKGALYGVNKLLSFQPFNLLLAASEPIKETARVLKNEEFPAAVALGFFDYLRKSRTSSFVLSLSGGADSSACAVLVAEMVRRGVAELGVEKFKQGLNLSDNVANTELAICAKVLHCAYQGTKNSSEDTFNSAKDLAESIGANFYSWLIDEEVHSYSSKIATVLGRDLSWQTDDVALQNIQARSRSPIIWMLTNITRSLLLTTSNRSEGDVGYATMDGDTSGGLAPIAGVDKQFIREWLVWAEKHLGYTGLQAVNNLAPSAELRPLDSKQTDEDDLMPYPILADIERLAIFEYQSPKKVFDTLLANGQIEKEQLKVYVTKFYRLWSINQWKRERLAPSFHLDDFNVDPRTWCRFPILSGSFKKELEELAVL